MLNTYKVTSEFSVFNFETKVQRTFKAGETVKGSPVVNTDGTINAVNVDGYLVPVQFLEQMAVNLVWILAGIGVAFVIVAVVLYFKYKK